MGHSVTPGEAVAVGGGGQIVPAGLHHLACLTAAAHQQPAINGDGREPGRRAVGDPGTELRLARFLTDHVVALNRVWRRRAAWWIDNQGQPDLVRLLNGIVAQPVVGERVVEDAESIIVGHSRRPVVEDEAVLVVAVVAGPGPVHRAGNQAGVGAVGVDDHELVVHEAEVVLNLDGNTRCAQALVLRKGRSRPQQVPDPFNRHPGLLPLDHRVGQVGAGEKEDGEVDRFLGGGYLIDQGVNGVVLRGEVDLERAAVVVEGGGQGRILGVAEAAGKHLLKLQTVNLGQQRGSQRPGCCCG
jgi:hypothetical protein